MRRALRSIRNNWKKALPAAGFLALLYMYGLMQGPYSEDFSKRPRKAAEFALPDLAGNTVRLVDFKGKVVLLDFWATYCQPCLEELPELKALYRKYQDRGFAIVSISKDFVEMEEIAAFVKENDVRYPSLYGGLDALEGYPVMGLPTAYLIDKKGFIVKRYTGYKFPDELERDILAQLNGGDDGTT